MGHSKRKIGWGVAAGVALCAVLVWLGIAGRSRALRPTAAAVHESVTVGAEPPPLAASPLGPTSLSGIVKSGAGGGVHGAHVCAVRSSAEPAAEVPECADAEADGHYTIEGLGPGAYAITAEAEGYFPGVALDGQAVRVAAGESKVGLDIVLEEGGAKLAGRVLDATGGVVQGATVRAMRAAPPHRAVAVTTRADGSFALWVYPGSVSISAEAVGYAPLHVARIAPAGDLTLVLTPGSSLQGVVVAAKGGEPVPNVEVRAVPTGSWASPVHRSATSNGEGTFSIQGLEPGEYTLVAEGEGWRSLRSRPLDLGLAQTIDQIKVVVSAAARVEGKVVLRGGEEPCASGSVALGPSMPGTSSPFDVPAAPSASKPADPHGPPVPAMMAGIGPEGDVRFRGVPPGTYHVVVQCPDHLLADGPTSLEVADKDITNLRWEVDAGLGLTVHVVDEVDRPVPGARFVMMWPPPPQGGARPVMPLTADADGRYQVPSVLRPGTYRFEPAAGSDGQPLEIELHDGQGKTDATLRLRGAGAIVVNVKTADGAAVDDVTVRAVASSASGGADASAAPSRMFTGMPLGGGRFRISPLDRGRYWVQVLDGVNAPDESQEPSSGVVDLGARADIETTVTLDRGGSVRGRVVDGARQGVPDVWVSAKCGHDGMGIVAASLLPDFEGADHRVVSDAEGRFTIAGLTRRGACTVRAEQPYGATGVLRDVRAGDEVVVALPSLGVLAGTAVGADGRPVEALRVSVRDEDTGTSRTEELSCPGGQWRLGKVMPGKVQILASDPSRGSAQQRVELAPGQTLDGLRLELAAPLAVAPMTPPPGGP
jgi:hypothetical protein